MLYISTALYVEAQPFIKLHSLKQQHEHTKFQVFSNNEICLIITGVGELKASIAITYLLSKVTIKPHDLFLNFGLCGSIDTTIPLGSIYAFHKIRDYSTKRDLYPDMVLHLPFPEANLETCPLQVGTDLSCKEITEQFVDMEAYAIMYAVSYYMQPHQVLFLKVVSDYANRGDGTMEKTSLQEMLWNAVNKIDSFLLNSSTEYNFFPQILMPIELSSTENDHMEELIHHLHLSETMRYVLKQHIIYYKSRHQNADNILTDFVKRPEVITCKSKIEGKKYFEQLKTRLME
ncbi:MAG: hypothetical protein PUC65_13565 [Clostridiales bacterium]|nr:hypothetical protein [Clostridiales bacterium]